MPSCAGMNRKLYDAAARQACFGSLPGTLHHLVVGDTVWLKRFTLHPSAFAALAPPAWTPA